MLQCMLDECLFFLLGQPCNKWPPHLESCSLLQPSASVSAAHTQLPLLAYATSEVYTDMPLLKRVSSGAVHSAVVHGLQLPVSKFEVSTKELALPVHGLPCKRNTSIHKGVNTAQLQSTIYACFSARGLQSHAK